jgi:RNA polymerase sigma factor (sigma-70 family)
VSPRISKIMRHSRINDAQLLRAAATDKGAFRVLYERYADRIHRYHLRRSRDKDAAAELTAETFAQAWSVRGSFRDEAGGSAGPWLFAIARNTLLQSVRRLRLEDAARQQLGMREGDAVATPDESWLDGIDELLDELPAPQREAVRLRFVEDLPYEGVADRLEITPESARMRVHRALASLRRNHDLIEGDMR